MTKTGWRQTDIRDFLCEHEFGKLDIQFEKSNLGLGHATVAHRCKKCSILKRKVGIDSGPIS